MATLELDNAALSSDLSELRQVFEKTRVRCEQQINTISHGKDALDTADAKNKVVGEENKDLQHRLRAGEEDFALQRARLHAALEELADQASKAQTKLEQSLLEQQRLSREIENVRKEKKEKDLYVTDIEGKLTSRESLLSDVEREILVLKDLQRATQEAYEKTKLRRHDIAEELSETKQQRVALATRLQALEQSFKADEAATTHNWMRALTEIEQAKRAVARLEGVKQLDPRAVTHPHTLQERVSDSSWARSSATSRKSALTRKPLPSCAKLPTKHVPMTHWSKSSKRDTPRASVKLTSTTS